MVQAQKISQAGRFKECLRHRVIELCLVDANDAARCARGSSTGHHTDVPTPLEFDSHSPGAWLTTCLSRAE
eukprot:353304-Chlamydomonas_euryale.AAC.8